MSQAWHITIILTCAFLFRISQYCIKCSVLVLTSRWLVYQLYLRTSQVWELFLKPQVCFKCLKRLKQKMTCTVNLNKKKNMFFCISVWLVLRIFTIVYYCSLTATASLKKKLKKKQIDRKMHFYPVSIQLNWSWIAF